MLEPVLLFISIPYHTGGPELVEFLYKDAALCANPMAKAGVDAIKLLFDYCALFQVPPQNVSCMGDQGEDSVIN